MTALKTAPLSVRANHVSAAARGERLYPRRSSRIWWHLTGLRQRMEEVTARYVTGRKGSVLVDYGCGNMPYRPLLAPHVERYVGVDLPGNDAADLFMPAPDCIPLEAGAADVVLSSQVLEHVADPAAYLAEAHRVLRDEGLLILSTHGIWQYHPDPCDYWRWTSAGLRKTVEDAGFRVVYFRGIMGPASAALQHWQDAVWRSLRGFFRKPFAAVMQVFIRLADRACPDAARDADAGTYVVVAEKIES